MIDIHQDVKVEAFKLLGREAFSEKSMTMPFVIIILH